ncbi:hypothetical protein ACHAPG_004910 [Botrytis cinerea]
MAPNVVLTPPNSTETKASNLVPVAHNMNESSARDSQESGQNLEFSCNISLDNISPVENWNAKKRKRQDLAWSHRKANVPTNGYGLTKEEMKTYRESSDKFENILAAHAASGVIPYVVDFKISLQDYTRLLSARDSIRGKLPIGDSLLAYLEFLERWIRLTPPVFTKPQEDTTADKWIDNMKEQNFRLRESTQWGPLFKLYEQWIIDENDFYAPRHDSLDSLDYDSE